MLYMQMGATLIFLPFLLIFALLVSLPGSFIMRWNARKWGKIADAKLGRTFLLCFCWIVAGALARPLWQAILPFSLRPFVWFCYMGVELVVWGVILLPLGKFFWRTSWRQAGMVSGIWTGQWLALLCVLYLAAPSLIESLSASGARPQAG